MQSGITVILAHVLKEIFRCFSLSPMPHYGFNKIAGTAIVQEVGMSVYLFLKPDTPKRSSAPFIATRQPTYIVIIQTDSHNFGAHIMQQKIRIGVNCLTSQPWQTGTVQQHGARGWYATW